MSFQSPSFTTTSAAQMTAQVVAPAPSAPPSAEAKANDAPPKKDQPRMRSSIACARCRRSKVKCINNGVNTTCRACEATGRECTYPAPAGSGQAAAAAREAQAQASSATSQHDSVHSTDVPPKRHARPRKAGATAVAAHTIAKESPRAMVDALDPAVLTPKVWTELFDIFQLHYSTELPFLHPPTFLKPLRQFASPVGSTDAPTKVCPPGSQLLLLAFLALTARFHPTLVDLHSPATCNRPSNPIVAAEYYASAAKAHVAGNSGDGLGMASLDRAHSLLMLGLHEWGMCRGSKAWVMVGVAVRIVQVLGLQYEEDLDDMPLSCSKAFSLESSLLGVKPVRQDSKPVHGKSDAFVEQEIRRRTFWSCFIMDRMLSSGKYRPQMLHVADVRVQLPSSERAFLFAEKVRTLLLGEGMEAVASRSEVEHQRRASVILSQGKDDSRRSSDEDLGRWEVGQDEGALSRYVKALDLYGKFVKWSCAGGRRRERFPPWDSRSSFDDLRRQLDAITDSLPRDLALSNANISAHITSRTSTPYILLHSVLSLCNIVLNREYIPFVPLRCSKPQGPLDPPLFPPSEYHVPVGFWESSARKLFKTSRDLIDLLRTCQDWGVLVETPIVGFAAYTVAFVGVYAVNFPWMDPEGYMCGGTSGRETGGLEASRKALEIIGQLKKKLRMADGWFKTIRRTHLYFLRIKKDYGRSSSDQQHGAVDYHLSLRDGGQGGGLEEFKLIEQTLKEFGKLDEEVDMMDVDGDTSRDETSDAGSAIKSEGRDHHEGSPDSATIRQDRWNAINSNGSLPGASTISRPSSSAHYSIGSQPVISPLHMTYDQRGQQPFNSNTLPPLGGRFSPPQSASISLQQQLQAAQQQPLSQSQPTYSTDGYTENFGGDDLAAFIAGSNWQEFASVGGWLSTVWGSPSMAM